MGAATVETALGPVATGELGPTLMHEHIVTRSPGVHENWPHLWDRDAILATAERKMADLHRGLMERGSTIGMDRFGLEHFLPTARRVEVIARLCAEGYAGKMVLSHDANCWTDMLSEDDKRRIRPLWHYNHLSDDILPALRAAGVTEDQIQQMLVRNPQAILNPS